MKKITFHRYAIGIILFGLSLLPLVSFLTPGFPVTHDGQDHIARIANFYRSLSEGNIVPRWAGNLNWGYGHPILMFLYPFSSYIASAFHSIGFSFVDSTKLVFVVGFVASVLSMYLFVSSAWGKRAGYISALLYGYAPYRFVDLYVRGSIGEHMAFVFPPLICYFLYKLATNNNRSSTKNQQLRTNIYYGFGLSVSTAFLILSHNAIALMFFPVVSLYGIYLFIYETNKSFCFLLSALCSLLLGFGLSAFFWIPAYFEGKYTLRDIVTGKETMTRFVPFSWFFWSPWNYGGTATLTKSLGFSQWIGIVASLVVAFQTKEKKLRILLSALCFLLFASIYIMTSESVCIWEKISILQKFQFPWRFLSVTTFLAALIGGISISVLLNKMNKSAIRTSLLNNHTLSLKNILFFVFCVFLIASTTHMWHPKSYDIRHESFFTGIYLGTTDTGESSPIWSIRFMEHTPPSPMEVISGSAIITPTKRTSTVHEYQVTVKERARLLENTLFFPGWKIYVDGIGAGIQFQDPTYRGLMTFRIDEGDHVVQVIFTDTKLRMVSNAISIGSFFILCVTGIVWCIWKRKK